MSHRGYSVFGLFLLGVSSGGAVTRDQSPNLPFAFVENKGQAESTVRYVGAGPAFKASFRDCGVTFQQGAAAAQIRFVECRPNPVIDALTPTGARANYFRGADPRQWKRDLPLFRELRYRGVWPGIEIRFKADNSRAKAEYVVAPGTSLEGIRLRFDGRVEIQSDGSLIVSGRSGQFHEDKPFLYQKEGSGIAEVRGGFRKLGESTIGFTAKSYDPRRPLIVDPTILFSGYFGGTSQTTITGVAVNSYYNTIVIGWTVATDLPAAGGVRPRTGGGVDAFVAGFSPAGGALIFCTYLGGAGDDRAFGVAVDSLNNTYVTGWTSSTNFPVSGALQSRLSGSRDAFVTKLNAAGNALIYSTYIGGAGVDAGNAIALDSSNAAVIVGDTASTDLPVTVGAIQSRLGGGQDAFVAKLSPSGNALTFMTYLGGGAVDHGAAVQLDASNSVFIGGSTYSPNFPTLNAFQPHSGGGQDGFVAKLSASGTALMFSTYLGGSGGSVGAPEGVNAIALSNGGNLKAAGVTSSRNFPIVGVAAQATFGGGLTDGFVCSFVGATGVMSGSTYLGGSGDDAINAIVGDRFSYEIVSGSTTSTDFPVMNAIQSVNGGGMDAFVVRMTTQKIVFGTYLGGRGSDSANAIAIDSMTSIVVAGSTGSGDFPVFGGVGAWSGGVLSSFVTKLAPNFDLNVVAPPTFYFDVWHNTGYNGPNITLNTSSFGLSGDIPVSGDWTGSGVKRIGVFRSGTWLLDINGDGIFDSGDKTIQFGQAGDRPVVGDWNGTGQIKLGLFRQGSFILDLSGHLSGLPTGLSDATFPFGLPGDIPVAADWNLSGMSKVGVFRSGLWLVDYNGDHVFNSLDRTYAYGQAGDLPVVGDWVSLGWAEIGVYRQGVWILNYLGNNAMSVGGVSELILAFGGAGYLPLVK